MTETISADDGTIGDVSPAGQRADLRSIAINPDFWYPVAESGTVKKGKAAAATFAGERIALYRGESGTVHALEDRCAHRQVPLSMGVVEGDVLRCCCATRRSVISPAQRAEMRGDISGSNG